MVAEEAIDLFGENTPQPNPSGNKNHCKVVELFPDADIKPLKPNRPEDMGRLSLSELYLTFGENSPNYGSLVDICQAVMHYHKDEPEFRSEQMIMVAGYVSGLQDRLADNGSVRTEDALDLCLMAMKKGFTQDKELTDYLAKCKTDPSYRSEAAINCSSLDLMLSEPIITKDLKEVSIRAYTYGRRLQVMRSL